MPLPRLRITVRRMMIAVALIAVVFSFGLRIFRASLEPLKESYRRRCASHARIAEEWNRMVKSDLQLHVAAAGSTPPPFPLEDCFFPSPGSCIVPVPANFTTSSEPFLNLYRPIQKKEMQARAAYHAAMSRKYERAARYPWHTVAPDPPPP
jgi:hypothetical protein